MFGMDVWRGMGVSRAACGGDRRRGAQRELVPWWGLLARGDIRMESVGMAVHHAANW